MREGFTGRPWFEGGLRFTCTGCGKCCTGSTGSVNLSQADLERLADFFHMPAGAVARKYTRKSNGRRKLVDRAGSDACVFLEGKSCSVYEARPTQCRTYPWWISNIQDRESWEEAAKLCEGINHPAAPVISAAEILDQSRIDAENDADELPWARLIREARRAR
jgi:Fe-S-cluster containining protein